MKKLFSKIHRFYLSSLSCEQYARKIGVKIGKNCLISTKEFPSEPYLIEIGDGCRIASKVKFFTHGGLWSQRKKMNQNLDIFGKIIVGNYTYIGEGAMILMGVTIGNDCIVGAGTVVTKSIPDNCIVGGNPMRYIGKINDFVERAKLMDTKTYGKSYEEKKRILLSLDESKFIKKPLLRVDER